MKSITNVNIINRQTFNLGDDSCEHQWVYDKPSVMMFTSPPKVVQDRICSCCLRNEKVTIEGNQSKYNVEEYTKLKER